MSRASCPLATTVTRCPSFSSIRCSSFWFTVTSSATRIRSGRGGGVGADGERRIRDDGQPVAAIDDLQNGRAQLGLANRFRQRAVDVQLAASREVARPSRRRQHDDGRRARAGSCLMLLDQHEAVHGRHLAIDEQQRHRLRGRAPTGSPVQTARPERPSRPSPIRSASLPGCGGSSVVVHDQRAQTTSAAMPAGGSSGVPLGRLQQRREVERAAVSLLALDPDAAAHQLDQALRDRQAEAGAAVLPGRRAVGLGELLEDQRLLARRGCRCRCRESESAAAMPLRRDFGVVRRRCTTSPRSVNFRRCRRG